MSTIKVNSIKNTSTDDGGIAIDNSGHVQIDGQQLPTAGQLSNRSLIINGAMQVSQRATQVTGVTTSGYITCDRYYLLASGLGTWTIDQSTDAPDGFANSFKATCTTADASPATGDALLVRQAIEAQNLQHLKFGTSAAESLTLSFYVKSNKTGAASVDMYQPDASNRQISKSYTINSANTWEYKTITFPGDTSGVINDDNGVGLYVEFWLNSGSQFSSGSHQTTWGTLIQSTRNASNLGVGGAVSDTFAISGVQLEVGEKATPFEHRSFGDELARCQRYFCKSYRLADAPGTNTVNGSHNHYGSTDFYGNIVTQIPFPVNMRSSPSMTFYKHNGTAGSWVSNRSGSQGNSDNTMTTYLASDRHTGAYCRAGASAAGFEAGTMAGHWTASSEL